MAAGTKKAASIPNRPEIERVVDFEPARLRAPFLLRCAAVALDYMVFIFLPVAWLLFSRLLSESATGAFVAGIAWYLGVIITVLNLLVVPLIRGQSVGKMAAGLTILKTDGTRAGMRTILLRNLLGYAITLLTLGLGFLIVAFNNSGRALHDLIAGTIVVRGRKSTLAPEANGET